MESLYQLFQIELVKFLVVFPKMVRETSEVKHHFHPQMDCQVEHTIQTIDDMVRAFLINFKRSSDEHFPFVEFSYNNSYHLTISLAPFDALYGRRFRSSVGYLKLESPYSWSQIDLLNIGECSYHKELVEKSLYLAKVLS